MEVEIKYFCYRIQIKGANMNNYLGHFFALTSTVQEKKFNIKKLVIKSQKPLQYDCEQLQWLLAHLIYIKSRRISYRLTLSAAPKHSHSVATPTRTSKINIPWPGLSHALFFICFPWRVFGEHFVCALQHHNTFTQSVPEIWHTAHSNNYIASLFLSWCGSRKSISLVPFSAEKK